MLGWVRIQRGLLKNRTWLEGKAEDKVVLITSLLLSTYREEGKGEFRVSKDRLLQLCGKGCSDVQIYNSLIFLEERGFLTFSEGGLEYHIKISNWEHYQNSTTNGWIKLNRGILDNFIWRTINPKGKVVMVVFLLLSNYKSNEWFWNGKIFSLKAGDLITSIKSIMASAGNSMSFQSVRTAMGNLEKRGFIKRISSSESSLISIIGFGDFIDNELCNKETTRGQQRGNKETTRGEQGDNKPATTNKKDKKNKNYNKGKEEKNLIKGGGLLYEGFGECLEGRLMAEW